jgi:predicted anti-sigma-YlaC factor YlaD
MSNHVTEWLNAYLDGELRSKQHHQVEEHLFECDTCQAELESLQSLSVLLHEVPAAEFTSNEHFVSQVNLLLPKRQAASTGRNVLEISWWMVPIGLLMAWVFVSTALFISDALSVATNFGLLDNATALISDPSDNAVLTSRLGQVGVLEGNSLQWAEMTESLTRNVLPQFIWQISIAILYLTWIVIWWTRQMHQGQVPLLES